MAISENTTNKKILLLAFKQAEANGWDLSFKAHDVVHNIRNFLRDLVEKFYMHIIFDHSFAKAFWGTEYPVDTTVEMLPQTTADIPAWKFFLREMSVQEDPVKYLAKFIKPETVSDETKSFLDESAQAKELKEELLKDKKKPLP